MAANEAEGRAAKRSMSTPLRSTRHAVMVLHRKDSKFFINHKLCYQMKHQDLIRNNAQIGGSTYGSVANCASAVSVFRRMKELRTNTTVARRIAEGCNRKKPGVEAVAEDEA